MQYPIAVQVAKKGFSQRHYHRHGKGGHASTPTKGTIPASSTPPPGINRQLQQDVHLTSVVRRYSSTRASKTEETRKGCAYRHFRTAAKCQRFLAETKPMGIP